MHGSENLTNTSVCSPSVAGNWSMMAVHPLSLSACWPIRSRCSAKSSIRTECQERDLLELAVVQTAIVIYLDVVDCDCSSDKASDFGCRIQSGVGRGWLYGIDGVT